MSRLTKKNRYSRNKKSIFNKTLKSSKNILHYDIAIPSYYRPDTLQKKTLKLLKYAGLPSNKITIFVANQQQKDI